MSNNYTLYGMPASLYTGKVRSYFRKQGIAFTEYGANHPDFQTRVMPAVGRFIMPVVEAPDGTIVQDGTDIIDHVEQSGDAQFSVYPDSALLRVVSLIFELFGGEGLLRPAMHYRWSFDELNLDFIRSEFIASLAPVDASKEEGDAFFDRASGLMRKAASGFGVSEESGPLIESSYREFLLLFAEHLKTRPYLLGGTPTIGDFGLIAALYAHLDRDPAPSLFMRRTAPAVGRWVERMHGPESTWVEHQEDRSLIGEETLPETLKNLLRYVAEDYLPELRAHVDFANAWLDKHPELKAGTNGLTKPGTRTIGETEFSWRGTTLKTLVMPYRFYLLQRVQDAMVSATATERAPIQLLLDEVGLGCLPDLRTRRRVERINHLEVWGELRKP
ncbi:glutathione S-transferase N-terminal domain-containing protein [Congregibacter sp.]|uniref:glutathione S-transferase N-terminal domain-containing protein n=1 Tax=Congregibacter sp. TaxID=2744308 RepID=UPI003F6B08D8